MTATSFPHSRACGPAPHIHGPACHSNCPSCGGKEWMTETMNHVHIPLHMDPAAWPEEPVINEDDLEDWAEMKKNIVRIDSTDGKFLGTEMTNTELSELLDAIAGVSTLVKVKVPLEPEQTHYLVRAHIVRVSVAAKA